MKNVIIQFLLYISLFIGCGGDSEDSSSTSPDLNNSTYEALDTTAEPFFKYQWYLGYIENSFSSTYGISEDSHINVQEAWKTTYGEEVKVAIIDENFEPFHADIFDNVVAYYNFDDDNSDVSNNTDEASHGHSCAGIIASPVNDIGITGVAPNAKLILIKQMEADDAKTIEAFEYAKQQGAKVISCSWGTYQVSEAVAQKIQEIYDSGITVVFAFGNDAYNLDNSVNRTLSFDTGLRPGSAINDEAELDSVIGVGASSEYNERSSYSSYGSNLDLLAPGGDEVGLVTTDETGSRGYNPSYKDPLDELLNTDYTFFMGSSASAPITAGVVALMLSVNPNLTPDEVHTILIQSADQIGLTSYDSSGFSIYKGYGKINAANAVKIAKNY